MFKNVINPNYQLVFMSVKMEKYLHNAKVLNLKEMQWEQSILTKKLVQDYRPQKNNNSLST